MAVLGTAKEKVLSREKREDKDERYYRRVFIVRVTDHKDDALIVEKAFGLPKRGYVYTTEKTVDKRAFCYSIQSKQVAPYYWEIECEYSTDSSKFVSTTSSKGKGDKGSDDPVYDPPVLVWSTQNIREVVTGQSILEQKYAQDPSDPTVVLWDSTGILNSAFEPYVPPAEIDRAIPVLTLERNEATFNHRDMLLYVNSVNSLSWYKWKKRCVKCAGITGSLQQRAIKGRTYTYWRVQYVFHFNKYTWDLFLLDTGSYYLEGGSTAVPLIRKPFVNKGVPYIGLLTSNGDKSTRISRYNRYSVLDKRDFRKLHIPVIG